MSLNKVLTLHDKSQTQESNSAKQKGKIQKKEQQIQMSRTVGVM